MSTTIQITFNTYNYSFQQEAFPIDFPASNRNHYLIDTIEIQYIKIVYITEYYLKKIAMTNTVH
jgi:hypothetical protein